MWLADLGVDKGARVEFSRQEVDVVTLTLSGRDDLKRWGLTPKGDQIKLLVKAKQEQERLNEVKKRHGVDSIRTNTYGDGTDKGGIQFCTKDTGSEIGVKAVLSADGRFGIGVEGEPEAKLHVKGDAIFDTGHCDRIHMGTWDGGQQKVRRHIHLYILSTSTHPQEDIVYLHVLMVTTMN
jgi:hypothetical protein